VSAPRLPIVFRAWTIALPDSADLLLAFRQPNNLLTPRQPALYQTREEAAADAQTLSRGGRRYRLVRVTISIAETRRGRR
jgi:hypothetical protein